MTNHLALLPTPPEPQPPAQGTVAQPVLPLERDHDLPPRWDDNSVTWHGWNPAPPPTTWELHHHTCPELCEACGSTTPQTINRGTVRTPGPRTAGTTTTHPGKIRGTLIAMRCPDWAE